MRETDKHRSGIIRAYESLFPRCGKYLEIGIYNGGSLEWARDFYGCEVYGIDITLPDPIEGVTMVELDQADTEGLVRFGEEYGPFDLIIDDGSHVGSLTLNTFEALHRFARYYVIEDWGAGYLHPDFEDLHIAVLRLVWDHGGYLVNLGQSGFAVIGTEPLEELLRR